MTAEPDAAPFAARPARARRPVVLSVGYWVAMFLAMISLLIAAFFVVGPRLLADRRPPHASALAARESGMVTLGEAPAPVLGANAPAPVTVAANPPASDVAGLQSRVANLEAREGKVLNAASEALAVAALSRVVDHPQPFAQTLSAFAKVLPGPDVATLAPLALQGAPTRAELARSLDDLAARVAAEARAPVQGASWPARLSYALSRLVSLRRVDPAGSGPDGMIARAEIAANAGDIEGALDLLSRLPPSTTIALAAWRDSARRRVAIDQAVAGLQTEALADLAVARSAPP